MSGPADAEGTVTGQYVPGGVRSLYELLDNAVTTGLALIGAGLTVLLGGLATVTAPIRHALTAGPVGGVRDRLLGLVDAVGAGTGDGGGTLRRWLARNLPQAPAPTATLPYVGVVPPRYVAGGAGVAFLVLVPIGLTAFQLAALVLPVYLMVFAVSWDVVSGYTGQISFGHTVFFALGGYTSTILNLQHGVTPLLSIPMGAVVAGVGGLLIGFPALRVRGPYLSLITLIAPLIFLQLVILFNSNLPYVAPNGLGGVNGFVAQNDPLVGTGQAAVLTVPSFPWMIIVDYYLALALFVAALAGLFVLTRGGLGDVLTAIRENEDTVESVGLNAARFKLFAFALSGAVGGLAGAMFVHSSVGNPLNPQQILTVTLAVNVVIMAILGGMGTIVGAALGAIFFVATSALVAAFGGAVPVPFLGETLASLMPAPLFVVALLVLIYQPRGLLPLLVGAGRWLAAPPERREELAVADGGRSPLERTLESYREAFEAFREG